LIELEGLREAVEEQLSRLKKRAGAAGLERYASHDRLASGNYCGRDARTHLARLAA